MYFKVIFLLLISSAIINTADIPSDLKSADSKKNSDSGGETTTEGELPDIYTELIIATTTPEPKSDDLKKPDITSKPEPEPEPKPNPDQEKGKDESKDSSKDSSKDQSKDQTKDQSKDQSKPDDNSGTKVDSKETETPVPKQPEKASGTGLKKGSVWGIAIGVIGMVATTVLLVVYILKRRRGDDRLIR